MSEDALVSELRAAGASIGTAIAGAQAKDWAIAEQAVLDAQERTARILRELALKLGEPPAVVVRRPGSGEE